MIITKSGVSQHTSSAGFYVDYQYERAYKFLEWMVNIIHADTSSTNPYRGVGMLEVVNEPQQGQSSQTDSMRQNYYPTAWKRIRAAEANLGVAQVNSTHIQMMVSFLSIDQRW